jgi:uncharacterized phage protein gp47/JayE
MVVQAATFSTVSLTIGGAVGTVIYNGSAIDTSGNVWLLPASVTVPGSGTISVTATAKNAGNVRASAGTVTGINTPTLGWNSVTNPASASVGANIESDAAVRRRQALSTQQPTIGPLGAVYAAVWAVSGVTAVKIYENTGNAADGLGIPAHSFAVVVTGGDDNLIAAAIASTRGAGVGTYGTTAIAYLNSVGLTETINFSRPILVTIQVRVTLRALPGYTTVVGASIQSKVAAGITALAPGDTVYYGRQWGTAVSAGSVTAETFDVDDIKLRRSGGAYDILDLTMAYNEEPDSSSGSITLVVT